MSISRVIKDAQIVAIVCNQWGDTGKGKFADFFAAHWADVIARGTGGNNAGHTVVVNDTQRIFHLLPTGIIHDGAGKVNILGNGMVIDIKVLCREMDAISAEGLSHDNLMIAEEAHVIMPYHIGRDKTKFTSLSKGGIGSTGRGIGPCYTDRVARRGIFIRDLFDKRVLRKKIEHVTEYYAEIEVDADAIISEMQPYIDRIRPYVRDTITEIHNFKSQGKKILLEGAQGLLLSIDYGTYPYVTSSDSSINGTAQGTGLSPRDIDLTLGVVKFPYMTRVGGGPFPTELGGPKSEKYCAQGLEHDNGYELEQAGVPFKKSDGRFKYDHRHPNIIKLMNSDDHFEQGVGIRLSGAEYGATTARPRRVGWTDLMALKYAVRTNGPDILLTKVDVLQGAKTIKLCDGYEGVGPYRPNADLLCEAKPHYKSFPGFDEDLRLLNDRAELPKGLEQSIAFMEEFTGARVRIISTGPDRSQTIVC
jgi:adenylosuccinate synthase